MIHNKLQLNPDKTDAMLVWTKHKLSPITTASIEFGNMSIPLSTAVKYLGVVIVNTLSMQKLITQTCQSCSSPRPANHATITYAYNCNSKVPVHWCNIQTSRVSFFQVWTIAILIWLVCQHHQSTPFNVYKTLQLDLSSERENLRT